MAQDIEQMRQRLARLPRVSLAFLPTPLQQCSRLAKELGGPHLYIKRDDLTGLAFGGNKVRQHEYILGDALQQGADCFVQGAAAQSNHSRQLAAAGARLGVDTYLLPKDDRYMSPVQGNLLIDHIVGAHISPIEAGESTIAAKAAAVARLSAEGRQPFVTGMGADRALMLAAVAYVDALFEIVEQMPEGRVPAAIYTASQGSTQGGMMLACEMLALPTKVVGIAPMRADHEARMSKDEIVAMIHAAGTLLGHDSALTADDIELRDEFVGPDYGAPSPGSIEAISIAGRLEGLLLDPVYSGKAFAGLMADVRSGRFRASEHVVFLHTGGLPALFVHAAQVVAGLDRHRRTNSSEE